MRIQVIETTTNRPLANTKVQIQVKGPDSGFLTLTTDANGHVTLDGKYNGQQIAAANGGAQGQWITANEGAKLAVGGKTTTGGTTGTGGKQKDTTTTTGRK